MNFAISTAQFTLVFTTIRASYRTMIKIIS